MEVTGVVSDALCSHVRYEAGIAAVYLFRLMRRLGLEKGTDHAADTLDTYKLHINHVIADIVGPFEHRE